MFVIGWGWYFMNSQFERESHVCPLITATAVFFPQLLLPSSGFKWNHKIISSGESFKIIIKKLAGHLTCILVRQRWDLAVLNHSLWGYKEKNSTASQLWGWNKEKDVSADDLALWLFLKNDARWEALLRAAAVWGRIVYQLWLKWCQCGGLRWAGSSVCQQGVNSQVESEQASK